jgi:iron(III) transport system permease protein
MSATADAAPRPGRPLRAKLGSDDLIMRGYMLAIAAYLVVALALPLYAMLSKSFSTYSFDLAAYEFQVSDEAGNFAAPPVNAEALNQELNAVAAGDLATSGDGRLPATTFFPEFSFRSPVMYRIRGTTADVTYLIGSERHSGTDWLEVTSNDFRRVMLRPAASRGLDNFATYFSTPALFRSIQNSLLISVISTMITVSLAFGFAYALSRSCMRFKGFFRLVAVAPILVPSLLPGIALVYLFGNQGMLKELLMGGFTRRRCR